MFPLEVALRVPSSLRAVAGIYFAICMVAVFTIKSRTPTINNGDHGLTPPPSRASNRSNLMTHLAANDNEEGIVLDQDSKKEALLTNN